MTQGSKQATRRVVIGGAEYDKPYEYGCGACRSPWLQQIDVMLAEGYALAQIVKHLGGLKPRPPNVEILRAHIPHLAEPHLKARRSFEAEAEARGDDTTTQGARLSDALQRVVRAGSERLALGEVVIEPRDMLKATDLLLKIQRSEAAEGVEASAWQQAFMEFFEIVRRRLTPDQWRSFVAEVYDSPVIRTVLAGENAPAIPGGNRG